MRQLLGLFLFLKYVKDMAQRFILSDESVNSYGFIVKTKGIDTTRFCKNPIMLYNHDRNGGVIGRWERLRVVDGKLLADAVFDEKDGLGSMIKNKVERGFINSVSIGINPLEEIIENGVRTVIKSELIEVSIVDIPANPNAVKTLRNSKKMLLLSYSQEDLKSQLIKLLGLDENTSDAELFEYVKKIVDKGNFNEEIDEAYKNGVVDEMEKQLLYKSDKIMINNYLSRRKETLRQDIKKVVRNAYEMGKLFYDQQEMYIEIGEKIGIEKLKKHLSTIPKHTRIADLINDRDKWTLDDYRKNAPEELKNNPHLYESLVNQEKKQKSNIKK